MATRDRIVTIPFSKGIDTKINDIISEDPMTIENARIDTTGVLRKRNGHDSLTNQVKNILGVNTTTITNGRYIFAYNSNLYLNDGSYWYQYNTKREFWNLRGQHELLNLVEVKDNSNNIYEYRDTHSIANETYAVAYDSVAVAARFTKSDADGNILNTSGTFFTNVIDDAHDLVYDGTNLFYAFIDSANSDQITILKFDNDLSAFSSYVVTSAGSVNPPSVISFVAASSASYEPAFSAALYSPSYTCDTTIYCVPATTDARVIFTSGSASPGTPHISM